MNMGILASIKPPPLPGFLNSLTGPLDQYGHWAIALLLLLENIGVPVVPGEFAMIGGAIFAGTGRAGLNIVVVGVVSVIASFAGTEIGYLIGRFAGRELILHYGKYVFLKPHHLDRAEAIVSRYGGFVVIVARFIVGLREANGIIAGITEMRWLTFTIYNAIGACVWVATWVTVGDMAGDHINTIYTDINRYALYLLVAAAVLLAGFIAYRVLRRRRSGAGKAGAEGSGEAEARDGSEEGEAPAKARKAGAAGDPEEAAAPEDARKTAVPEDAREAPAPGDAGKAPGPGDAGKAPGPEDAREASAPGDAGKAGVRKDSGVNPQSS